MTELDVFVYDLAPRFTLPLSTQKETTMQNQYQSPPTTHEAYHSPSLRALQKEGHWNRLTRHLQRYLKQEPTKRSGAIEVVKADYPSLGSYVVNLYWREFYNTESIRLITGLPFSWIRKILGGEGGRIRQVEGYHPYEPPELQERRYLVDRLASLEYQDNLPPEEKRNYIALLRYLGYSYAQLVQMFPGDRNQFRWMAAMRSGYEFENLRTKDLFIPQRRYDELMVERVGIGVEEVVRSNDPADVQRERQAELKKRMSNRQANRTST